MKNTALIVVSCDGYTELGKIFFDLQQKYMGWFEGNRYFINESKEVEFEGVKVIHAGLDKDWSGRLAFALEQIPEKYLIFMLEDYFIGKPVDQSAIEKAVALMEDQKIKYYKITNIPKINKKGVIADYLPGIPNNLRYGINLQAAIIEKSFLMEMVQGEDRSAWKTETDLIKKVSDKYTGDIPGCVIDTRNIIDIHNGVIKGKWYGITLNYFKRRSYVIDKGSRAVLPFKSVLYFHSARIFSHILPTGLLRKAKRILRKFGFAFLSED